jgi:hypothetical protein
MTGSDVTDLAIHRFLLPLGPVVEISMPAGARILSVTSYLDLYCALWALVDIHAGTTVRKFRMYQTHMPVENKPQIIDNFIGTVHEAAMVWHVFEERK